MRITWSQETIEIPNTINNISSLSFLTTWLVLRGAFLVEKDGAVGRTGGGSLVLRGTFLLGDHITHLLLLSPALSGEDILTVFLLTRGTLLSVATRNTGNLLGITNDMTRYVDMGTGQGEGRD